MSIPNLSLFAAAAHDFERTQYEILGALRSVREEFARNKVYPFLAELVDLHSTLVTIQRATDDIRRALPNRIKSIDWEKKEVIYEQVELADEDAALVEELIEWAVPHIRETIEEGTTIYEFVEENMSVESVGLIPSYVEEGYLFVPEHSADQMHVIRYAVSLFTGPDRRYRSLKTTLVDSLPVDTVRTTPETVKLDLIETGDLPNPATYFFDTDLDFPFEDTIFPIAKRKLLHRLYE
jgi:hypothetical protein